MREKDNIDSKEGEVRGREKRCRKISVEEDVGSKEKEEKCWRRDTGLGEEDGGVDEENGGRGGCGERHVM